MAKRKPRKEKVDQRLRAKVKIGLQADGKPIYKWVSATTQKELDRKKEELVNRYVTGYDTSTLTLGEYVRKWLPGRIAGLSASTVNAIVSRLNVHILPTLGGRYIRSILREDLLPILDAAQARGLSRSHLLSVARIIREIFASAHAEGVIRVNPAYALKAPVSSAKPIARRALTPQEDAAVLHLMGTHPHGLYLTVLYYLGLRRGEALGLQWSDFDWQHHTVNIQRDIDFAAGIDNPVGDVKSDSSHRTVPIPQAAEDALRAARGIGWVFARPDGQPYRDSDFRRVWRALQRAIAAEDTTIEQERGRSILTPHYFRHNYASVLHRAKVPVEVAQEWLGHSSIAVTMDIYTHLDAQERAAAQEGLSRAF